MILDEDIAAVKSAVNMRQLASAYGFRVNRLGYMLCPFHNDKHASLRVYDGYTTGKDGYICWACGAGGTIFNFVMEYDGVDFESAVRKIAGMFGISVSDPDGKPPPEARTVNRTRIILAKADEAIESANRTALIALSEKIRAYENELDIVSPYSERFCFLANELPKLKAEWDWRFSEVIT